LAATISGTTDHTIIEKPVVTADKPQAVVTCCPVVIAGNPQTLIEPLDLT
jgi:hypothetical protein